MTRLPELGRRGEGWFALQLVLFSAIAVSGVAGPTWGGLARAAGAGLGAALIAGGGILALRGVLDLRENLSVFPKPLPGARLVESGAYRMVRHPIYCGLIFGAVGWGLLTASPAALVGAAVLFGFFDLKSRREETWLAEQFEGYPTYRNRTRRLLPWLY